MKVSAANYLLDAGPLIGLLDKSDQWHEWSSRTLAQIDEPLATTETALAEACHRLKGLRPALQELTVMLAEKRVVIESVLSERPRRVGELLSKYPEMDVGDATLVGLSEIHAQAKLITLDRDFQFYRRNRNQPIPLVSPTQGRDGREQSSGLVPRSKPPSRSLRALR